MDIEVVDKMPNATDRDIILKLISDKKKYKKRDTIHFALYEYSKYYEVSKITTKKNHLISLPKVTSNGDAIQIEKESDTYRISGIESLEKQLENDFEVIDFDWDLFRTESIMEKLNGSLYIKTLLMSFDVLPKHKGKYTIAASEFIYLISKSNSDYFGNFTPTGDGSYKVNIPKNKIHIKSNELSFIVK